MLRPILLTAVASAASYIVRVNSEPPIREGSRYHCNNFYNEVILCRTDDPEHLKFPGTDVMAVWPDGVMHSQDCQRNAEWHLSAVNGNYPPTKEYAHDPERVTVFVVDTWVDVRHPEFEGRATQGQPFNSGYLNAHGTHVAGLIASKTYGVNKNALIVAVQVLNSEGSGTWSQILGGLDWINKQGFMRNRSIINISIGGGKSRPIEMALEAMSRHGWRIVVAAGNAYNDACWYSPSGADGVVVVGAFDKFAEFPQFSNNGKCVDILAPGVDVLSTIPDNHAGWMSGTSMASPIVAGVWSLNPQVPYKDFVAKFSVKDKIRNVKYQTPNVAILLDKKCAAQFAVQK